MQELVDGGRKLAEVDEIGFTGEVVHGAPASKLRATLGRGRACAASGTSPTAAAPEREIAQMGAISPL
ncbi:hypothetical protein MSC49_11100 [Methylosinus sp. C49]|nr:hypothetical protein MSC49_11100 [Methylosinus sp. C49]